MIRKGDNVIVTTGREKGKTGKVLTIFSATSRALIEKVNMVKRHQKPTQKMPQGGIVQKESSIDLSNLMIYCGKCQKGVRVGIKTEKDGAKVRTCKKCGEVIGQ